MTAYCFAQAPNEPDTHCNRPLRGTMGNHPEHSAYSWVQNKYISWPNEDYVPTPVAQEAAAKGKLKKIAEKIRANPRD